MKSVTRSEAESILSDCHTCPDIQEWWYDKNQPSLARCSTGLVGPNKSRSGLFVELMFADPPKTRLIEFKFTVFRLQLAARQRIYQLHVNSVARAPKNWHDMAHEHMGLDRIDGTPEWLRWGFREALDYFSQRTNITFEPPVRDPSVFELTRT
jgi:hypothetical protein